MIDIEAKVFTTVATAVRTEYDTASVYGEAVEIPESFPCVTVEESDNYTYRDSQDTDLREHHANLMYTVNIYSNAPAYQKKLQAKRIFDLVDQTMQDMKFTRTSASQIRNVDRTVFRITARYIAVVGAGKQDGDNTVYQMYRR
jgi:hypothetical protein